MIELLGTHGMAVLIFCGLFFAYMFVNIYSDKNLK